MLGILVFVGFIGWLVHLVLNHRPGHAFNHRDIKAFQKAKSVREDLDEAKNYVAPAAPKPDYNLTLGFSRPKAEPAAAPEPAATAASEKK